MIYNNSLIFFKKEIDYESRFESTPIMNQSI